MIHNVVIGVGSNIEPQKNISRAKILLAKNFRIMRKSRFIKTTPVGKPKQPSFRNGAIFIKTDLTPTQLKNALKKIEAQLGRTPTSNRFSPRTIDLDIIVWDGKIVDKDFYHRDYLKKSILEIIPDLKY